LSRQLSRPKRSSFFLRLLFVEFEPRQHTGLLMDLERLA
jgi:hypothetical protein